MTQRTVEILSVSLFVAILTWGLWTFLYYLGVPAHGAVLLSKEAMESIAALCNQGAFICRGVYGFFPFVTHTLLRVPFLVWYAVVCAFIYGVFLLWKTVRTGSVASPLIMAPWKLLLLMLSMVWLLFTSLTLSGNGQLTLRTIVEPRPEVYQGAGEEALASLAKNYDVLKSRNCLQRIGVFSKVAEASTMRMHCLQASFFTRVLPPAFVLLVLIFEFLIAGRFVLRRVLRLPLEDLLQETVLSLGIGAGAWIVTLWVLALAGIYTAFFGWVLLLLVPVVGFRHAKYWIEKFLSARWQIPGTWYGPGMLVGWFLLSYLALNYLNVIRPFPIGWDDLGSYLNRPRILVSYGTFVHSLSSFQWEYLTSLGFLLFGFESIFGATVSLVINWFAGVVAILSILLFGRVFLGQGRGTLAALLYYTLPLVGHFSFADMKIDNAVFAMGALATFCVFSALFLEQKNPRSVRCMMLLGGIFAGLAFSMKVTAIMVVMALAAVIAGGALHAAAFFAAVLMICAMFIQQGTLNIPAIAAKLNYGTEIAAPFVVFAFFVVAGVLLLGIACFLRKDRIISSLVLAAIFVGGFGITVFPWVEHNTILQGGFFPRAQFAAPNTLTPTLDLSGEKFGSIPYSLPPDLAVDPADPYCKSTAGSEELDRYWGNHVGWGHYFTLPWRSVMNLDHVGYYVTTQPALLLVVLLLLLPFFWRDEGRWLRWLWISTMFILLQWVFLASGVPWYGVGVFFGLVLCVEALLAKAPDVLSRSAVGTLITLGILLCLGMRLWQFETQRNLLEYTIGKISAETLQERTIPYYDDITDIVMERHASMPDRPLLFRVGTFMPYFIPKNLEVIGIADNQLDFFRCMYKDRDNVKTLARMKALGFNSIVFDLNTATIEKDPNGSLHQKVNLFTNFLNSPESGLQLVFYDQDAGIAFLLIP